MQISLDPGSASNRILAYGGGFIVVNEARFETSLIVMPESLITDWPPPTIDDLSSEHLSIVVHLEPELIIIGTGRDQVFPETEVLRPIIDGRIGFEIMDTHAACRTYIILMAEGRIVAAALLMTNL